MYPTADNLVFDALASDTRRRILDVLVASPGCKVRDVVEHFPMTRIAVMKHLAVLERAGLVHSHRVGRCRQLFFNAMPIHDIHARWTSAYSAFWASAVDDIRARAEAAQRGRGSRAG